MRLFAPVMMAVTMLACSTAALAQDPAGVAEAKAASARWLALSDAGNHGAAWDQSADAFRAAIARPDWEAAARALHQQVGTIKSRSLKSATYSTKVPGAPAGEYVVIQYLTQLDGDRTAIETVTPQRARDGSWKVSGYYIQ